MKGPLLDDPRADDLSAAARRLLRRPRPRFRGVLHRWAAAACVPIGMVAVLAADGARARLAIGVFAIGTLIMLGVSAITHLRDWPIERVERLVRADHSAIFVMFATSATPIAVLGMGGGRTWALLAFAWVGATLGVVLEYLPFHPPRGLVNTVYLTFGGSFLVFLPWLIDALSGGELALLLGGGAAYTVGAIIVGAQWPDPWTDSFGYHEIWHVLVVVGAGTHYVLALRLAGVL
ncbi:MAG: hemolysin III family protein [Actinomycetota bacterium]